MDRLCSLANDVGLLSEEYDPAAASVRELPAGVLAPRARARRGRAGPRTTQAALTGLPGAPATTDCRRTGQENHEHHPNRHRAGRRGARLPDRLPVRHTTGSRSPSTTYDEAIAHARGPVRRDRRRAYSRELGAGGRGPRDAPRTGITSSTDLAEAVRDADLVIEAVPENLELKRSVYAAIAAVAPETRSSRRTPRRCCRATSRMPPAAPIASSPCISPTTSGRRTPPR